MFHPLWLVLVVGLLVVLARRGWPGRGRRWWPGRVLLAAAWPVKNLVRFGFLGFSSWSGMSIARGLPTGEPLLPGGYQASLGAFARTSDEPPAPGSVERASALVPPEFRDRPALTAVAKPDGAPNWNHYALIPLSRQLGSAALSTLRERPSLLFLKALDFYSNGYALYEARWPYRNGYSPEMTTGHGWARLYEAVVFQPFRAYDPSSTGITTGFAIVFPLLLLAVLVRLWRRRREWDPADRTVVLLLLSIGWVLAMVLFVDGPEGNRVRFSTEPLLFLVAGWLVGGKRSAGAGVELPRRPDGEAAWHELEQEQGNEAPAALREEKLPDVEGVPARLSRARREDAEQPSLVDAHGVGGHRTGDGTDRVGLQAEGASLARGGEYRCRQAGPDGFVHRTFG